MEWMRDFDAFELALSSDSSYNANLSRSLSLTLDEFYKDLTAVGFSAVTGEGFDEFLAAVDAAVVEYETCVLLLNLSSIVIDVILYFEEITVQNMIVYRNFKPKRVPKTKPAKKINLKAISRKRIGR